MTPNKVIEHLDGLRPNVYDEETKLSWLNDVDCMVKKLVYQIEAECIPYAYPEDMDKELLIKPPFDNAYVFYLESMIDYYNREYGHYNNSAAMFENRFSEFKKAYIRGDVKRELTEEDKEVVPPSGGSLITPPSLEEPGIEFM